MNSLLRAVVFLTTGKLLFALQDVIIKEMSGGYPVHQIVFIRGMVAIPLILLIIHFSRGLVIIKGCKVSFHLFRGALMFTAFMAYYLALSEISLTVATALFFTAPFFITLLSIPMLGEKVGIRRFMSIFIGFIGVLIVLRPDVNGFGLMGILPIVAALFYACCQLMVRVGNNKDPVSVMTLYASVVFAALGSVTGLVLSQFEPASDAAVSTRFLMQAWSMPQYWDWLFLIFTGVTSGIGFMLSSSAYRAEEASKVAPFEYVMMLWVVILSYLVWSEIPDPLTCLGVVIIVSSGVYVLRREKKVNAKSAAFAGLTRR
ncbi:MAG: S-adenosylmethionine uptake transporter [Gammaproteobacteria bacterium]